MPKGFLIIPVWILCSYSCLRAQGIVTGTVTDAVTRESISGANVSVLSRTIGTSTDAMGKFQLLLPVGPHTLVFSYVGYRTRTIDVAVAVTDTIRLAVMLIPSTVLMEEVVVPAEPVAVSGVHGLGGVSISPKQIQGITGALGDIGRVIQAMTGVTSNNEMSSQFNVRGGAAHENLLLLNGAQLLEPFHLKDAPNTSLSAFNTALLRKVLFIPGGFPARYGDRLSAVLDMEYRAANSEKVSGLLDASLTDGMALLEGPIARVGRDTGMLRGFLSFRTTYFGTISKYLLDGDQRQPSFYDIQGNAGLDLSKDHRLGLSFLHTSDRTSGITTGSYGSTMIALQGQHALSQRSTVQSLLSLYSQFEDLYRGQSPSITNPKNWTKDVNTITLRTGKIEWESRVSESYTLRSGLNVEQHLYNLLREESLPLPKSDTLSSSSLNNSSYKVGFYGENMLRLDRSLLVNLGFRLDHSALTQELRISPRFLVAYRVDSVTTLNAAWGLYYQTPTYQQLLAASREGLPPQRMQRAIHYVVGVERVLRPDLTFRVQAYYKRLEDLISFQRLRSGELDHSARNDARAAVKGVDFEASFADARVMGWLNFSLMEAREINSLDGQGWRYRPTDQRITITAIFEYRVADKWFWNLRSYYGTGFAFVDDNPGVRGYPSLHYPDYKRIDVRLSHSFKIHAVSSTVFVEITNLLSTRNILSFKPIPKDQFTPDHNLLLPMNLNAGVRLVF